MKTYTLTQPGIACREGKIQVGESGRGRTLISVPVPQGGEYSADGKLLSIAIPGEAAGEVLVMVPDLSGFRGGSSIEKMDGCVQVARGYRAQGDAGRMGGGEEYLLRVAPGGSFTVSRSGRRCEWSTGVFTNVGGSVVFRNPAKEAELDAAQAALFGAAPVIDPAVAEANLALERARADRDAAAAAAQEAARRGAEAIRQETAELREETWKLQREAAVVADNISARQKRDAARAELANGKSAWAALDGLKL